MPTTRAVIGAENRAPERRADGDEDRDRGVIVDPITCRNSVFTPFRNQIEARTDHLLRESGHEQGAVGRAARTTP